MIVTYRILSLDGGGTWALIEVKALMSLFGDISGHAVLANFDMAVANSGGSIVLGGLLENKLLSEVLGYFEDDNKRRSIFSGTTEILDDVTNWALKFGPKYSTENKLAALERLLPVSGGQVMTAVSSTISRANNTPLRLLITGFDYDRNVSTFFRSAPAGGPEWGQGRASSDVTLAEAIHASSTAPVNFFDEAATWDNGQTRYWDGAIAGCNNPVLAGVTEAITVGVTPTDIRALSLGTGTVRFAGPPVDNPPAYFAARAQSGLINDLAKLAGSITDDPPDSASFIAHVMTGGAFSPTIPSRIIRLSPLVGPVSDGAGNWKAPGAWTASQLNYLAKVDLAALDPNDLDYIADYADLWLQGSAYNQPVRMDFDSLTSKLGAMDARAAIQQWQAIA